MTPLRERMLADLRAKNLPEPTQQKYIEEVATLALNFKKSPDILKPTEVRRYLMDCAHRMISDKLAALEFFYTETLGWEWDEAKMKPLPPKPEKNWWSPENPVRRRMQEDLRLRNLAPKTRVEYDRWVGKFAAFHKASPETLGMEDVRDYLVHLLEIEGKAVGSLRIVSAALKFFYANTLRKDWAPHYIAMPKCVKTLPIIPSQQEMLHLIASAPGLRERVIVMTCYGAGLRPNEVAHLKITDIDSQRMMLRVNQGKGRKDRYLMLSPRLLEELRIYWRAARPKAWLFPGPDPSKPTTAIAVLAAVKRAGKIANLGKPITPRILRHAFATHLLESGMRLEQIQLLMGHSSFRSTQVYARLATSTVCAGKSPLELLPTQ